MQTGYGDPRVIDAHVHFFSHRFCQSFLRSRGRQFPERDPQPLLERLGWEVRPPDPVESGRRCFRQELCEEQVSIRKVLGMAKDEAQLIMGGHIARLLDLD